MVVPVHLHQRLYALRIVSYPRSLECSIEDPGPVAGLEFLNHRLVQALGRSAGESLRHVPSDSPETARAVIALRIQRIIKVEDDCRYHIAFPSGSRLDLIAPPIGKVKRPSLFEYDPSGRQIAGQDADASEYSLYYRLKRSAFGSRILVMESPGRKSPPRTGAAHFAVTRWTLVLAAADDKGGTDSRRALEELIRAYWFPLYAYVRRQGSSPEQAEDLTQGFFKHLMEKGALTSVDRAKGKFRSFLLAALKNFLADERDKAMAAKRGGSRQFISLDTLEAEARYPGELADTMTPERLFEHSWAITLLNQVFLRLQEEYAQRGKQAAFQELRHALDGQTTSRSYAEHARCLGISEGAVRVMAHRMRKRYRELLRQEILQTVADEALVDDEIRYLLQCL